MFFPWLQMLVDLGGGVYVDDFESHFLRASSEFYQKEAQAYLTSSSCPEYMVKAEKRLNEEVERVKVYLDPATEAKITKAVETELVLNQVTWPRGGEAASGRRGLIHCNCRRR